MKKTLEDFVCKMKEFHERLDKLNSSFGVISIEEYLEENKKLSNYRVENLWQYQDEIIAITKGSSLAALSLDAQQSSCEGCPKRKKIRKKINDAACKRLKD